VHHGLIEDLQTKVKAKNPRFAGVWATHPHTQDKYVLRPDGSWVVVRRHSPAWARVGSGNHGILRNRLVSAEILDPDVPAHKSVIDGVYMTMPVIGGIARELRRQL